MFSIKHSTLPLHLICCSLHLQTNVPPMQQQEQQLDQEQQQQQ